MTHTPRQPFLHDAVIALHAPTQVWSGTDGDVGDAPIHGVYHGDLRQLRAVRLDVAGARPEALAHTALGAQRVRFDAVTREIDDDTPDPGVRLRRDREVGDGSLVERITVSSAREEAVDAEITVRLTPDFAPLQEVKAGIAEPRPWEDDTLPIVRSGSASFTVHATDAETTREGDEIVLRWRVTVPARRTVGIEWSVRLEDSSMVVRGAGEWMPRPIASDDARMSRWLQRATDDLGALRLTLPQHPDEVFFAAGAPWFLTLFGRDSIWAARLALALAPDVAATTLRVLARMQGQKIDVAMAEAPGKIVHELRSADLKIPGEGVHLPPRYFGTVDATPLWVCLLADARDAGLDEDAVRELLPAMRAALGWITEHGNASGNGFVDYIDESGKGLANQGWKDSGDSVQWRDGSLAEGPIALCEVQGYAYEAAVRGAEILDAFGEDGAPELREWASELRRRFRESYWVTTADGMYPAIALDAQGRAVDSLTSNIGHLIGTGILDPDEERRIAELLTGESMASGYGIRTLSDRSGGYWPLGYHRGSVWPHDTAIIVQAMARAGLTDAARTVATQLLDAAERFDDRVPELHSGDAAVDAPVPVPYPASCRPQAWSAAAAIVCAEVLR